jgi:uncharacterized membrane protein SpoIIM required for sporulation
VTLDEFQTRREPDWQALTDALARARGRPARLGSDGVLAFGALYRSAAADLAYARRRYPGDPVVARLEALVTRARGAMYGRPASRARAGEFVAAGYWQRVRGLRWELVLAIAVLVGACAAGLLWAEHDVGAALGVVPAGLRPTESHHFNPDQISAAVSGELSSEIITNNILAMSLAFAGGIFLGIGSIAALTYNGLLIGVIGGLLAQDGQTGRFFVYILPHGVLELSCIVVGAAAGLRMGMAIVSPGRATRGAALRAAAFDGVVIVLGTACFLVVAGFTEGYVTPKGIGLGPAIAVGFGLAGIYWVLVLTLGRHKLRTPSTTLRRV